MTEIRIPSSIGDAADRITILEIKAGKLTGKDAIENVTFELSRLRESMAELGISISSDLLGKLRAVNARIFELMDELFLMSPESEGYLDKVVETMELNKERSFLKLSINRSSGSAIVEEKTYFGQ